MRDYNHLVLMVRIIVIVLFLVEITKQTIFYNFQVGTPISLTSPLRFDILLFRRIANITDDNEIKVAVRKIILYDSGDGNEVVILPDEFVIT